MKTSAAATVELMRVQKLWLIPHFSRKSLKHKQACSAKHLDIWQIAYERKIVFVNNMFKSFIHPTLNNYIVSDDHQHNTRSSHVQVAIFSEMNCIVTLMNHLVTAMSELGPAEMSTDPFLFTVDFKNILF